MPLSNEFAAKNPNRPEEGLEDGTQDGCMEGRTVGRNDGVADGIGEEDGENVAAGGPGRVSTTGTATATAIMLAMIRVPTIVLIRRRL